MTSEKIGQEPETLEKRESGSEMNNQGEEMKVIPLTDGKEGIPTALLMGHSSGMTVIDGGFEEAKTESQGQIFNPVGAEEFTGIKFPELVKEEEEVQPLKPGSDMVEEDLFATPKIPETVYQHLPPLLKSLTEYYEVGSRERDVFTTGLFTAISGCLPNTTGIYYSQRVFTNLYSFIIAGAGNGKRVLNDVKSFVFPLHSHLLQQTSLEPLKRLIVPSSISSAMLIELLNLNGGSGIMIVPEADTLGYNQKKEWGNISDILRLNFQGEPIETARKSSQEYILVHHSHMAVSLSGTPDQVGPIIPKVENGLFSRFLYYGYEDVVKWKDQTLASTETDMDAVMAERGKELIKLYEYCKQHPREFSFTEEQMALRNKKFSQYLQEVNSEYGNVGSIVKRLGLINFRLAMIFSAIRNYSRQTEEAKIYFDDIDFNLALELTDIYLKHAKAVLDIMPESPVLGVNDSAMRFYHSLPKEFKREQIIKNEAKNLSERSMGRYLRNLVKAGKLEMVKGRPGVYIKC